MCSHDNLSRQRKSPLNLSLDFSELSSLLPNCACTPMVDHGAILLLCNLNRLLCEMDMTYLQFQPQWDLLQELSHDGSEAG